jgi:TonB family protein
MATPAASPERLVRSDERTGPRKAVVESGLITVEMCPAGFGLMLNVSHAGIGVYTLKNLKAGDEVQVSFLLPGTVNRVDCAGQVRWAFDSHAGLHLKRVDDRCVANFRKWITALPTISSAADAAGLRRQFPSLETQVEGMESHIADEGLQRDGAVQFLANRLLDLTSASGAAIAVREAPEMVCRASAGLAPEIGVQISSSSGLTGECIRSGKMIYCEDTELDSRVDREACRELNLRCSLIVPVTHDQEVEGVLELFSPRAAAFGEDHRWLAQRVAEIVAHIAHGASHRAPVATPAPQPELKVATTPVTAAVASQPSVEHASPLKSEPLPEPLRVTPLDLYDTSSSGHLRLWLMLAFVFALVLVVILVRHSSKAPSVSLPSQAPAQPAAQAPASSTPAAEKGLRVRESHPSAEPQRARDVDAPETVETPIVVPRGQAVSSSDNAPVEAPTVEFNQSANLSGVPVPVITDMPQLKVSAVITGGSVIHREEPNYPTLALRRRIEGDVILQAHIAKDGTVASVRQVKGSPVLGGAAIAAVRKWRYEPFKRDNVPQEMDSTITIQFHIPKPTWLR